MKIKETLFKEKKTGKILEEVKQCNPILGTIHNLWVVGTMGIWRGPLIFIQNIYGGHQISVGILYIGGT